MQQPSQAQFFAEISASAAKLAEIAGGSDNELPVPSCPDWTLRQLATHIGRVHRWAAQIVRTRSPEYIPFSAVPDGAYPAAAAARAAWLTAGASSVIEAVAAAGEEPVWTFGDLGPASFWARRQAHETMVHRADAELTAGRDVVLDRHLAADGIDEWLSMVARRRAAEAQTLPAGKRLALTAEISGPGTGSDPDGSAAWLATGTADGLTVVRQAGDADVRVTGPADQLLLVLVRRIGPAGAPIEVSGEHSLFTGWLESTPF